MSKIECHECGVEMGADSDNPQIAYCQIEWLGGYVCEHCSVPPAYFLPSQSLLTPRPRRD